MTNVTKVETVPYPVRLVSHRLVLRDFRPDDAEAASAIVGDDRVTNWLSFDSRSLCEVESMIAGACSRAREVRAKNTISRSHSETRK